MSCQESGRESKRDKHNISCIWDNNNRLAYLSDKRGRAAVSEAIALWDESRRFPRSVYQDVPSSSICCCFLPENHARAKRSRCLVRQGHKSSHGDTSNQQRQQIKKSPMRHSRWKNWPCFRGRNGSFCNTKQSISANDSAIHKSVAEAHRCINHPTCALISSRSSPGPHSISGP